MKNKIEKVDLIIGMASGKPFQVIKARKTLHFEKYGHSECFFECKETGEVLSDDQIISKYIHHGWTIGEFPRIQVVQILENNGAGDIECTSIVLPEIPNDEILIK